MMYINRSTRSIPDIVSGTDDPERKMGGTEWTNKTLYHLAWTTLKFHVQQADMVNVCSQA